MSKIILRMPVDSESLATRMYALVIVCEVLAIAALWLFGRAFSV